MRIDNIVICLIYLLVSCSSSKIDINSGLVAHYKFDGNARDLSGGKNHLKVNEAVLTTDRFGNKNSAYGFNGITSDLFAEVTKMPAMESAKTISWWYLSDEMPQYTLELGAENMIVLVDSIAGMGVQFGYRAYGYETKGFDCWEWGGGTFFDMDHPEFNSWHHCTYTYQGTTHTFYIDGEKVTTSTVKPMSGVPNQLMLGNYPGGSQFYKGKLDDIRIYNRALLPSEVNILFKSR